MPVWRGSVHKQITDISGNSNEIAAAHFLGRIDDCLSALKVTCDNPDSSTTLI